MGRDRIANANAFGQTQNALPDLLHGRSVFGLDRDKAVGNDSAEKQSNPRSLGEVAAFLGAHEFAPIHRAKFVERAEDFIRKRHDHVFDFFRHLFDVDPLWRLRGVGAERYPEKGDCAKF